MRRKASGGDVIRPSFLSVCSYSRSAQTGRTSSGNVSSIWQSLRSRCASRRALPMQRVILGLLLLPLCGAVAAESVPQAKGLARVAARAPRPKQPNRPLQRVSRQEAVWLRDDACASRLPLDRLLRQRMPRRRRGASYQRSRLASHAAFPQPQLGQSAASRFSLSALPTTRAPLTAGLGFSVGDMSQPRGGPMVTGHSSHQIGLDVDIWLTPMPTARSRRKSERT